MFDSHISALREQMVQFCKATLEGLHQRGDYKEFLQLSLIFLGSEKVRISFRAPEAFHHARWMANAIYSISRIFLFYQKFSLTTKEKQVVKEMALFVSLVYIQFWHEPPLAIRAPLNVLYYYLRSSENIQI